jgi:hypothetical protein
VRAGGAWRTKLLLPLLLPVPLGLATYLGWRWRQHRRTAGGPVAGVR